MTFPDILTPFDRLAARRRIAPGPVLAAAIVLLLAAIMAIATRHFWIGAGLLAGAVLLDGLSDAQARLGEGPFRRVPLILFLPAFGFALADPGQALAALFLVTGAAILVSIRIVDAIKIFVSAAYLAACFLPDYFSISAYIIGFVCFVLAGQGAARGR